MVTIISAATITTATTSAAARTQFLAVAFSMAVITRGGWYCFPSCFLLYLFSG